LHLGRLIEISLKGYRIRISSRLIQVSWYVYAY